MADIDTALAASRDAVDQMIRAGEQSAEGRIRLETAHQKFDEACRRIAAEGRPMTTGFGLVPVQDLVRSSELHMRHHTKQMAAPQ